MRIGDSHSRSCNCPQNKHSPHYRHSGIFIPRQRNENIRNLRRKAGLPSRRSFGGILSHAQERRDEGLGGI